MNIKRLAFVPWLFLPASALWVASQQVPNQPQPTALAPQPSAGVSPASRVQDPSEAVAPFRIHPQTGELMTPRWERIDDPVLNSPEKRNERLLARWIIENPREYWKVAQPKFPPKGDPVAPQFDILRPQLYAASMRARETPEQRKARKLASQAIRNPLAYQAELERMKQSGRGN